MVELAPAGASVHFTRMSASGSAGTHAGQEERNRSQIASLDNAVGRLAMVSPQVIVMAAGARALSKRNVGSRMPVIEPPRTGGKIPVVSPLIASAMPIIPPPAAAPE
jgi:hypothetical protein